MWNLQMTACLVVLLGIAGPAIADEEAVEIKDLPAKVVKTIMGRYPDAELTEAIKDSDEDSTTYHVTIRQKGTDLDLVLTPAGKLKEIRKEVDVEELPKKVLEALKKKFPKATVKEAEEVIDVEEHDEMSYDLQLDDAGQSREVSVAADGASIREDLDVKELPKAVADVLKNKFSTLVLKEACEVTELDHPDAPSYDLVLRVSKGKTRELNIDAKGRTIREEIDDADLPKPVRDGLRMKYPKGKIEKSTQISELEKPVKVTYQVIVQVEIDKQVELLLSSKGKLLNEEPVKGK